MTFLIAHRSIHYKIEKSPAKGGPTTHTVRTSFETAFEVDKQVTTAVKAALLKLANCPSMNKDEVKELLHRISQNPETDDNSHQELSEFSSECESDTASELTDLERVKERKYKKKQAYEKFNMPNLVEMMLERLRCLQEDELASLATKVATCGLNAALAEAENSKLHVLGLLLMTGSVLVKHSSQLEKDIDEAKRMNEKLGEIEGKNSNRLDPIANAPETASLVGKENVDQNVNHETNMDGNPCNGEQPSKPSDTEAADSLDKILVKPIHRLQRLKMQESSTRSDYVVQRTQRKIEANSATDSEGLDKILVKHVSKLEKEKISFHAKEDNWMNVKKRDTKLQNNEGSLDQILVKHKSRLEKEKMAAVQQDDDDDQIRHSVSRKATRERELQEAWGGLSLGN
ncbi:hypothetical protein K7X08_008930 [Anisodus acutangulus]|uniref:Uncharacterized protein n=1 Tax=Anisodus acutangulus TaxID=402998 RepID=A0A9Q1RT07_9SOLA|nr:hypothetical protein K7X08_008930 [Anisodus acutangulus]